MTFSALRRSSAKGDNSVTPATSKRNAVLLFRKTNKSLCFGKGFYCLFSVLYLTPQKLNRVVFPYLTASPFIPPTISCRLIGFSFFQYVALPSR